MDTETFGKIPNKEMMPFDDNIFELSKWSDERKQLQRLRLELSKPMIHEPRFKFISHKITQKIAIDLIAVRIWPLKMAIKNEAQLYVYM